LKHGGQEEERRLPYILQKLLIFERTNEDLGHGDLINLASPPLLQILLDTGVPRPSVERVEKIKLT